MTSQTSGITSERPPRPQPHGGMLLTGPSNRGGPGRTPKHVKNLALEIAANGTRRLKELIEEGTFEGKPVSASAWAQAWKMAADVGIDKTVIEYKISASVEVKHCIEALGPILASHGLTNDAIAAVIRELGQSVKDQVESEPN